MSNETSIHIPVLTKKVIQYLVNKDDGTYVDCTFGLGGHSLAILKEIKDGQLIAFDWDKEEIEIALQKRSFMLPNLQLVNDNFINFPEHLKKLSIEFVDGFLLDLGLSSYQLNCFHRGLSFRLNAPLNMNISCPDDPINAAYIVNNYSAERLTEIFREFGEERLAGVIANKIVKRRQEKQITETQQLVGIIASCFQKKKKKHPARKVFQALRIYLNKELENLTKVLNLALSYLKEGGRIAVISYNSLEDRIVKRVFKEAALNNNFCLITKKVITPEKEEIKQNNRARSAKLRVIERINIL